MNLNYSTFIEPIRLLLAVVNWMVLVAGIGGVCLAAAREYAKSVTWRMQQERMVAMRIAAKADFDKEDNGFQRVGNH